MKIAITADLHWGSRSEGDESTRKMVALLQAEAPDVIVLAGDIGSRGLDRIHECLDLFSAIDATRLFIAGNHDVWTRDGNSEEIFRETLRQIGRDHGFHYLQSDPMVLDGLGIAGTMGWYDYSFRDESLGLDTSVYERKRLPRVCSWNDRRFVRWGCTDGEFCELLVEELEATLEDLSRRVDRIVAITHHLPFEELVRRYPHHIPWAFANAYMGSASLGRALLRYPRVTRHFCGHSHVQAEVQKGPLHSVNVGSTYTSKRYEILEIETSRDRQAV